MCRINKEIDIRLSKVLALLMQYAKDEDIELLILNCLETVELDKKDVSIYKVNLDNPKELIMHMLTYDLCEYKETGDAFYYKKLLRMVLIEHLNCIVFCYLQYHLPPVLDNDKANKNATTCETQKTTDKIDKIKYLKKFEVTNILHNIIDTYKSYKFYYAICDTYLLKILIKYDRTAFLEDSVDYEILYYNIMNQSRTPYIVDRTTMLNLLTGKQIIIPCSKSENTVKYTTYEAFLGYHKIIVKALSLPLNCHWCYPDIEHINEKIKCNNCTFLLQELKSKTDNVELKDIDFNKYIDTINLKQGWSISELRIKRGNLLNNFVKKNIKDKEVRKSLKSMIDKSFSTYIKL